MRFAASEEDEERRPDPQVIVRGNHGRVTAFCLKSVTKRGSSSNSARGTDGERDRKRKGEGLRHN